MKKNLVLLLFILFAFTLVGCKRDKGITVRFGVISGQISQAIERLQFKQRFEDANPGVTVEIVVTSGGYDELRKQTILDINSGNRVTPDLVLGYPDHFAEYFGGGVLVNLQPYIDNEEYGYSQAELDDFVESYLNENKGFDNDNPNDIYGLPFNKSSEVMIFNKTAFEIMFGEDGWEEKVPATWEELETLAEEIIEKVEDGELDDHWIETADNPDTEENEEKKRSVSKLLEDGKFVPFGYDSSGNGFITLTRQWGGAYTERDNVAKGYILFDNPKSKEMMTYLKDLNERGIFNAAANYGSTYCSDALKDLRCLITVGSTAGVRYNESDKYEYELGVAPIPYKEADKKFVIQQGTNIGILDVKNSEEELLAAWKFLKFMLEPENTAAFAMETGGYFPVRKSAYEDEEYQTYLSNPSDDKKAYSQAANIALNFYIEDYTFFVDPAFIGSSTIRDEVGNLFDDVLVNKMEVDAAYSKYYRALQPYVRS
jgi:multiple sugar transport system substrate-binding protein